MKKLTFSIALLMLSGSIYSQTTNIFPLTGNAGVGTITPKGKLEVLGTVVIGGPDSNIDTRFTLGNLGFLSNSGKMIIGWNRSAGGGETDFISNQADGSTGGFGFYNYSNAGTQNQIMLLHGNGNVGIGTGSPTEKLSVNGNIRAREVKVENANWPDYVFARDYQLLSLKETERYIKEKGHLPNIPSAEEVKANGISLGDMNAELLKKIEELTLYLIEIKEENQQMKERIQNLEKR